MLRLMLLVVIAFASACEDSTFVPTGPLTVHERDVIAGGTFQLTSQSFRARQAPVILADSFALTYLRTNDTTLLVNVPVYARGQLQLVVDAQPAGQLEVAGFEWFRPRTIYLEGNPVRYPANGPVSLIAGDGNQNVVQFTPATGAVRTLLSGYWLDNANTRSIGPTTDPDVFLLQPVGSDSLQTWLDKALESWDLSGVPTRVRSFPRQANHRVAAQLNDSIFLAGSHHQVRSYQMTGGFQQVLYSGTYEETNAIALSPRKDRAAIRVHGSPTGPPVFDMATGDTAYHIRSVRGAEGVAFSTEGDTLLVLGYNNHDQDSRLLVLDAASGHELNRFELPYWIEDLAFDPATSIAYLGVTKQANPFEEIALRVLVFDVTKMQIIGEMSAHEPSSFPCFYRNIFVGTDGVYFVCGGDTWRFDRVTD